MLRRIQSYIEKHELVRAGERVGVAVSGGADSVALLRILLELRAELGIVLSVVHVHHGIRGSEADADEAFVAELAAQFDLRLFAIRVDVPATAGERKHSLEAVGRDLRHDYFRQLVEAEELDKIATAHTIDDQAETVLMRVLRGAGTQGWGGIYPSLQMPGMAGAVIRPLLSTRRSELRELLASLGQGWREDASNADVSFTRNRLRQELLPVIERDFNPKIVERLSEAAEIARGEELYWDEEVRRVCRTVLHDSSEAQVVLAGAEMAKLPVALQRRLVREAAARCGIALDFRHVESVLELLHRSPSMQEFTAELPKGVEAVLQNRELRFERRCPKNQVPGSYEYLLPIPGEVRVAELDSVLRARVVTGAAETQGYNADRVLDAARIAPTLTLRNWRAGDRFHPAHTSAPRKLKELLQERRIAGRAKQMWPVAVSGGQIVWVRDFDVASEFRAAPGTKGVVIEAVETKRS